MRLLDRYLGRAVIAGSLLALCILASVDAFIDFIDEIQDVGEHGYTLAHAVYHTVLTTPQRIYEFFPTAALLGSLLGLGNLAAHNELVVLRAAGVSVARIIRSVLKTGILMMIAAVAIGEFAAPTSERYAQALKSRSQAQQISMGAQNGLWARDGNRFIHVEEILPDMRLGNVRVYEFDADQRLAKATLASSAVYRDGAWLLHEVSHSAVSHAGVVTEHAPQERWPRLLSPGLLTVIAVKPEQMSAWELKQYIGYLDANSLAAERYELAFWTRFTTPLSSLIMLLLAVPFVFGAMRAGGAGQRLFIGIMIGLTFHLFNRALNHLALVYGLEPLLGATLPLLVFLTIGVVTIARMR